MKTLELEIPIHVISWKRTRGPGDRRILDRRIVEYYASLRALTYRQLFERNISMPVFPKELLRLITA